MTTLFSETTPSAPGGSAKNHPQRPVQRIHPRRLTPGRIAGLRLNCIFERDRFAIFYTRLHNRLLRPLMAADQAQAPPELRQALHDIDHHVDDYINQARLGKPRENLTQTSGS